MRTGKTKSGFKFKIDQEILESWDFVDLLSEVDENPLKSVTLLKMILGTDQIEALKKHLGGKPKAEDMFNVLNEILTSIGDDVKNS